MKILVIGGSYFYGRVFVMLAAKEHDVTVVNRGTYSMEGFGVRQIKGDRRDGSLWKNLKEDFDAAVDFCAYEKGDIAGVLKNMEGRISQYIFISTVDVYQRGTGGRKDEGTPLETRVFPGEAGDYIAGKVALEQELREECADRGISYTVLRPGILYGPYNYAPRESLYIQMMVKNGVLPHVTDASGRFQMVYVKDAAEAVCRALLNAKAYGQAYNLCQDGELTYDGFYEALKNAADMEAQADAQHGAENGSGEAGAASCMTVQELAVTVREALDKGIPLPFPVTEEESELYANEKSRTELGMNYISLQEGMARTYRAFKGVYGG